MQAERVVDSNQDPERNHYQNIVEVHHERCYGAKKVLQRFQLVPGLIDRGQMTIRFCLFNP